jgi:hypothetical protein
MGLRKWRQQQRPEIIPRNAIKRLEWARTYEHYTAQDWARIKWSDECSVERGAGVRPVWSFLRPAEQLIQRDVREIRCGKSVKQMLWAAFGPDSRTDLISLPGDPNSRRGGLQVLLFFDYIAFFYLQFYNLGTPLCTTGHQSTLHTLYDSSYKIWG